MDIEGRSKSIFNFDDDFIDPCLCNSWVATAIGGSALIGGAATLFGASKAADAQTNAANTAAATQMSMFNKTAGYLQPYRDLGQTGATQLTSSIADLTKPISVNPQDFLNSDYYKFLQTQGEKAVTNSSAARGLATSGAALKGAATFESGLNAGQYQQNFNNQVTNQTNAYNRLMGLVSTGENAAAGTGNAATTAGTGIANAQIGAGNAQAAGYNAAGASIANISNNVGGYAAYKGLYGGSPAAVASSSPGYGNFGEFSPYSPMNAA